MRILVIHAHPDPNSFNHAICETAVQALKSSGKHEVTVIDLYKEGFRAEMSTEERLAYESGNPILDPQVARYAELMTTYDGLLFVYPTWWWALPAIMKGFLERVLVPGVGFVLDPVTNKAKPGLRNIRYVGAITTYGSSWAMMRLFRDAGRRCLLRVLRPMAPWNCRTQWLPLYSMDSITEAQRSAFLAKVERKMRAL